jgi:hypothetical protein
VIRVLSTLTVILIGYFIYGFYLSQSNLVVIPGNLKREVTGAFYDYRGVTNVRTDLSNGSSSPLEVISEAKLAGLDYLLLTDVNQFERSEPLNGYNGNLLVAVAGEYSFLDSRLLFYDLSSDRKNPTDASEANLYFTDLLSQKFSENKDTLLVLAHPFNNGPTWTGSYPPGLDGLEILNPKAVSAKAWARSKLNVIWSFIIYPFNPRYAFLRLFREPIEEITLWDQLSKERPMIAFGGADASARAVPWANALLKFPAYQTSFEITNNHVLLNSELTGSYIKDRQKIMTALRKGHFYVSLDLLGDPKGFISYIEDRDRQVLMGEKIKFSKNLKLVTKLPIEPKDFFEIVVFKNGERDFTSNTAETVYSIPEPAVYRVVVRVSPALPLPDGKKWFTWIYTNNFYVN